MVAESSEVSARSADFAHSLSPRWPVDCPARVKRSVERVGEEILTEISRSRAAWDRFFLYCMKTRSGFTKVNHRAAPNQREPQVAEAGPLPSSEVGFGFGQLRAIGRGGAEGGELRVEGLRG